MSQHTPLSFSLPSPCSVEVAHSSLVEIVASACRSRCCVTPRLVHVLDELVFPSASLGFCVRGEQGGWWRWCGGCVYGSPCSVERKALRSVYGRLGSTENTGASLQRPGVVSCGGGGVVVGVVVVLFWCLLSCRECAFAASDVGKRCAPCVGAMMCAQMRHHHSLQTRILDTHNSLAVRPQTKDFAYLVVRNLGERPVATAPLYDAMVSGTHRSKIRDWSSLTRKRRYGSLLSGK